MLDLTSEHSRIHVELQRSLSVEYKKIIMGAKFLSGWFINNFILTLMCNIAPRFSFDVDFSGFKDTAFL